MNIKSKMMDEFLMNQKQLGISSEKLTWQAKDVLDEGIKGKIS